MSALRSHPDAHVCEEELVDHLRENRIAKVKGFLIDEPEKGKLVSGFKTKFADVGSPADFRSLLSELNSRIIVLERRNLVKQVVSFINGEQLYNITGDWNLYDGREPVNGKIAIDLKIFDRELKQMEKGQQELMRYTNSLRRPALCLYYEDLVNDPEEVFGWVTTFLSLPASPFHPKTEKNTSDDLKDVLENFEELKSQYQNTPYEAMFDEVMDPLKV
jgi:hypothetical protein